MKKDWKAERAKAAKHARLVRRQPELREQLYGRMALGEGVGVIKREGRPPDQRPTTRDTAQSKDER